MTSSWLRVALQHWDIQVMTYSSICLILLRNYGKHLLYSQREPITASHLFENMTKVNLWAITTYNQIVTSSSCLPTCWIIISIRQNIIIIVAWYVIYIYIYTSPRFNAVQCDTQSTATEIHIRLCIKNHRIPSPSTWDEISQLYGAK